MNKEQALDTFWNSFGIPAYDSQTVPPDAVLPYITYQVTTDSFDNQVSLTNSIWYRSTSWKEISDKASEVAERLGIGGEIYGIDNGYTIQ